MLSSFFKFLSILLAVIPSILGVVIYLNISFTCKLIIIFVVIIFIMILFCYLISKAKQAGYSTVKPNKVTPVSREMLLFLISSLLPILTFSKTNNMGGFLLVFCFIVLSILFLADTYYCSPLFAFLGYKMYQVEINGVVFLLITKKKIQTLEDAETNIVKLTSHICLDNS